MTQEVILWLFGTVITVVTIVVGAIGGLLLQHFRDCRGFQKENAEKIEGYHRENCESIAELRGILTHVEREIGNHDSGMIGQLHRYGNKLATIDEKLVQLKERQGDHR